MKRRISAILLSIVVCILGVFGLASCSEGDTYNTTIQVNSIEELIQTATSVASKSAVLVHCRLKGAMYSEGSGVVISSDGYILTNDHVVDDAIDIQVEVMVNGKTKVIPAYEVKEPNDNSKYEKLDLAVLQLDMVQVSLAGVVLTPVTFGDSKDIKFGTQGVLVGNPEGIGFMASRAMVSNPKVKLKHPETNYTSEYIALDAPVNPGNSGGGFYDMQGYLLGLVTLRLDGEGKDNQDIVFGIGFAVRVDDILGYLTWVGINI